MLKNETGPCPQLPCSIVHYSMLTIDNATKYINKYNATQNQRILITEITTTQFGKTER